MGKPTDIQLEQLWAFREILREALMTLEVASDPDARYRGWAVMRLPVVRDASEAYGYQTTQVRLWNPTPRHVDQMNEVLPMLAWLRRTEGERAFRRLQAWSLGFNIWAIAQKDRCGEPTVMNRINRSVAAIIRQFAGVNVPIEYLEEPYERTPFALIWEKPPGPVAGTIKHYRIYIGGKGMWKRGRYLRDGSHKIERLQKIS